MNEFIKLIIEFILSTLTEEYIKRLKRSKINEF